MIWVGLRGREVYGTWSDLSDDDSKNPAELEKKFEENVRPMTKTVYNRSKFQCRIQNDSETVDENITDLKVLAKECDYREQKDLLIRDRVVFGIKSRKIK